jgi:mono/diheme cytochrome c family protein
MMGGGVMGGGMMRLSCASCHGTDGHGLATKQFTSPDITYANLTDPKGMLAPDGTRGPTYTHASLRRAITTGIDPTGGQLAWPMPQWQLTGQEWNGLLAYLKTLH